MVDTACFGIFFSTLCFFCFVNGVIGPAFVMIEIVQSTVDGCGYVGSFAPRFPMTVGSLGPMFNLQITGGYQQSIEEECSTLPVAEQLECLSCSYPENLVAEISEFEYTIQEQAFNNEENFTGVYAVWACGALASLLTLVASGLFCKETCTIEGVSDTKHKVTSALSFAAAVSGAAAILVWNFVTVPDIKDGLSLPPGYEVVFNEECFSQILLIAGVFFSLVNACLAMKQKERDWDI